jgi:hypothetical protein
LAVPQDNFEHSHEKQRKVAAGRERMLYVLI